MSDSLFDVAAIGNAIVDVIGRTEVSVVERLSLNKGTMTLIDAEDAERLHEEMDSPMEMSGGSAANTLAGISSLGGKTAFMGRVRDDRLGNVFRSDMAETGIDFRLRPQRDGPPTGRCLIFVTPDADRTMQTYLGASVGVGPEDIDPEAIGSAAITYFEGYLYDLEPAKAAFWKAAELAHASGRKIALTLSDPFCVDRHRAAFLEVIEQHVDILFANQEEITSLYETDSFDEAVSLISDNVEIAAITRGPEGAVIAVDGSRIPVDASPVEQVVDTTGAGDLFAAGMLFGITRGYGPDVSGRFGAICAAEIISHYGARPSARLEDLISAEAY